MRKIIIVLVFGFSFLVGKAQIKMSGRISNAGAYKKDTTSFNDEVSVELNGKTKYTDYKIISLKSDTTLVDTTLTLAKDLKFNYIRKNDFELLPFNNQGETYTTLGYNFQSSSLFPTMGVNAKRFNYYTVNDIYYYHVPTPTSEVMYRSGLMQGQVVDAFLTLNTSKQFNMAFGYKGLRSLGKYRNELASHGNFRFSIFYHSENDKLDIKAHYYSYDLLNNENGGLTTQSLAFFESGNYNYNQRSRLDVNYTNASNLFTGKRYFSTESFTLFSSKKSEPKKAAKTFTDSIAKLLISKKIAIKKPLKAKANKPSESKTEEQTREVAVVKKEIPVLKTDVVTDSLEIKNDSLQNTKQVVTKNPHNYFYNIRLGHTFEYETQHYHFDQSGTTSIFGNALQSIIADHTAFQKMDNQFFLEFKSKYLGSLKGTLDYYNYNYFYDSVKHIDTQTIADKLKGNAIAAGAEWKTHIGNLHLNASATTIIAGQLKGNSLQANILFKRDSLFTVSGFIEKTSKSPNFNTLLYQSGYTNYNWQSTFKNESSTIIGGELGFSKIGKVKAAYNTITNYTYFNESAQPEQATETLNYFKGTLENTLNYRKFSLDYAVMYQQVLNGASFFRVPKFVTRTSLYYSNYLFKGKPLFLQTGITFKYFTSFKANAYNPLLSEFTLQNTTEIGNYPIFDIFANAQIQHTRIFFKIENVTASFTGRNYFSAPNYPYRDLTIRFGLVWDWFI